MSKSNNYKIIDSTKSDIDLVIEDYNQALYSASFKNLKIGVIGSVLLCSSPAIYANTFKSSYSINKGEIFASSVTNANDCEKLISTYIEEVNNLSKVNYTRIEIIDDILSFKSLVNNWDGYGAQPLEIKSASNSIYILNLLDNKIVGSIDDFYPNPQGTIVFEWVNRLDEKVYLEIGNNNFSYFVKYNSLDPIFVDNMELTDENIKSLTKHIQSL